MRFAASLKRPMKKNLKTNIRTDNNNKIWWVVLLLPLSVSYPFLSTLDIIGTINNVDWKQCENIEFFRITLPYSTFLSHFARPIDGPSHSIHRLRLWSHDTKTMDLLVEQLYSIDQYTQQKTKIVEEEISQYIFFIVIRNQMENIWHISNGKTLACWWRRAKLKIGSTCLCVCVGW
jgi:hypothetical protein